MGVGQPSAQRRDPAHGLIGGQAPALSEDVCEGGPLDELHGEEQPPRVLAQVEHPHQRERLVANPDLWARAPGEILRWTTPIRAMRRVAMADAVLGGKRIREGESVVLVYASANQDEDVFEHPGEFRVDRDPNDFLSLGFGPHYCLGANLAQMELRLIFDEIVRRIPDMELAGEPEYLRSNFVRGIKHMPVTFSPAEKVNPGPVPSAA